MKKLKKICKYRNLLYLCNQKQQQTSLTIKLQSNGEDNNYTRQP